MKLLDRLFKRTQEAAPSQLTGATVVRHGYPTNYIERSITPELIAADREVPNVLSNLIGLSRTCFLGFEWSLKPVEEGDDTQSKNIDKALKEIKRVDKRIGRIGKSKGQGTLGLVRFAALEDWSWGKSLFEYSLIQEGAWENFGEIQALPGQSFNTAPVSLYGQDRYVNDKILPGIVYDMVDDETHFFQNRGTIGQPIELEAANVLYIEDTTVPAGTSMLKALVPSIEQFKEIRRDGMLTMRNIGVGRERAQIDADAIAKLKKDANVAVDLAALTAYAKSMVEGQSTSQAELSILGMKMEDRKVTVPINPWDADNYLKQEILNYFFHKDVLEVTAQAISATNGPAKDLLDIHIASEREVHGRPFELLWNQWLLNNGFDGIYLEFDWWNWAPKDQEKEREGLVTDFRSHAITINEYREKRGYGPMDPDEIQLLAEEHQLIFGNKNNVMNPSDQTV